MLVDQLVRGDGEAWRGFVGTYGRLIRSRVADVATSFGQGNDPTAIDDAVAEVFAVLIGNDAAALRGFAGRSSLVTYLAVIATRSATRGFARAASKTSALTNADASVAEGFADPEAIEPIGEVIRSERRDQLQSLLARLPTKQRDVIQLFHLQSQSYEQISRRLNIPIGSIGPTLRRAEAKLKEWLEN